MIFSISLSIRLYSKFVLATIFYSVTLFMQNPAFAASGSTCDLSNVPEAHVVTSVSAITSCNAKYYYKKPSDNSSTWICSQYSTVPPEFVVTERSGPNDSSGPDCSKSASSRGYRSRIRRPSSSGTWACSESRLPAGFVVVNKDYDGSNASKCGTNSAQGIAYYMRAPKNGDNVCTYPSADIPEGFVVTKNNGRTYKCQTSRNDTRGPYIRIHDLPTSYGICTANSKVPEGYAITSTSNDPDCTGGAFKIGEPSHQDIVCGSGPPPEGFLYSKYEYPLSQCRYGFGYRLYELSRLSTNGYVDICPLDHGLPKDKFENPLYLVTRKQSSDPDCNNKPSVRITLPSLTKTYNACEGEGIPTGFAVYAENVYSLECGSSGAVKVGPVKAGSVYCYNYYGASVLENSNLVITEIIENYPYCSEGMGIRVNVPKSIGKTDACPLPDNTKKIPDGFVITEIKHDYEYSCAGLPGYTIEKTKNRAFGICSESPIPEGYVIVEEKASWSCRGTTGWHQTIIQPLVAGVQTYVVCGLAPEIPTGYVIVEHLKSNACAAQFGQTTNASRIAIPSPNGQTTICQASQIPDGFVVVGYTTSSVCSSLGTQSDPMITKASLEDATVICAGTQALPEGYDVIETIYSAECGGDAWKIIPISSLVTPSTFTRNESKIIAPVNLDCDTRPINTGFTVNAAKNTLDCSLINP